MSKIDPKEAYKRIKSNKTVYKETVHCPLIIEVMANGGTVVTFCKQVGIGENRFYEWVNHHKNFRQCYDYAKACAEDKWWQEGTNIDPEDVTGMTYDMWRFIGHVRFKRGHSNRIKVNVTPKANPYQQYQELLAQASEFTASELKQLMEAINVGRAAYDAFKLQEEVDALKADLHEMRTRNE